MATLPPLTFQTLRADGDDTEEGVPVVATGRTLQKQLKRHGVAHGRVAGAKRKSEMGFSNSTFIGVACVLVACGVAITLFLTLRD